MELVCIALVIAVIVSVLHNYWNNLDANARVADAWKLYTDMAERRSDLVVENTELQRRLETIEDALGGRE
jgi:hypothetical protein